MSTHCSNPNMANVIPHTFNNIELGATHTALNLTKPTSTQILSTYIVQVASIHFRTEFEFLHVKEFAEIISNSFLNQTHHM